MSKIPNINCTYYNNKTGGCKHIDKITGGCCMLLPNLWSTCDLQEKYFKPEPPPPPPPKRY
jgi:hypothetical protein